MNAETLNTPAYDQFEEGTLKLHELIRMGRESSAEANEVRDWLYGPWELLTPEQRNFGNGLSADLYMLNSDDGEVLEAATDEERSAKRLGLEIEAASDRNAWGQVLTLLRKGPEFFPPGHVAYLRARAYGELGRPLVALAFIRHARTLDAAKPSCGVLEIEYLRASGRERDAVELARRHVGNENTPVKLAMYAAGVVFDSTRALSDAEGKATWEFLARVLRRLLGPALTEDPSLMPSGYLILGHATTAWIKRKRRPNVIELQCGPCGMLRIKEHMLRLKPMSRTDLDRQLRKPRTADRRHRVSSARRAIEKQSLR
jgi:hypothetical protein